MAVARGGSALAPVRTSARAELDDGARHGEQAQRAANLGEVAESRSTAATLWIYRRYFVVGEPPLKLARIVKDDVAELVIRRAVSSRVARRSQRAGRNSEELRSGGCSDLASVSLSSIALHGGFQMDATVEERTQLSRSIRPTAGLSLGRVRGSAPGSSALWFFRETSRHRPLPAHRHRGRFHRRGRRRPSLEQGRSCPGAFLADHPSLSLDLALPRFERMPHFREHALGTALPAADER